MMLIQVLVVLIVCGIVWYFLKPYIAPPFDIIITLVVILFFCFWLLSAVGLIPLPMRFFHAALAYGNRA